MNKGQSNRKRKQEQLEWEDDYEFSAESLDDFEKPIKTSFSISTSSRETSYPLSDFSSRLEDYFPSMLCWRNNLKRKRGHLEREDIKDFFSELLKDFEIHTGSSYQLLDFNPSLEDCFSMSTQTVNSDSEWYYAEKIRYYEAPTEFGTPERISFDLIDNSLFYSVAKFSPILLDLGLSDLGSFDKLKFDKIHQSPELDAWFNELVKSFVTSFQQLTKELFVSSMKDCFRMQYILIFVSSFKHLVKQFVASFEQLVNKLIADPLRNAYFDEDRVFLHDFFPKSLEANSDDETFFLGMKEICDLYDNSSLAEAESDNAADNHDLKDNSFTNTYSEFLKAHLNAQFSSSSKNCLPQIFQDRVKLEPEHSDFRRISNFDNAWMKQQPVNLCRPLYSVLLDLGLPEYGPFDKKKFNEVYWSPEFVASFGLILGELHASSLNDERQMEEQSFFSERSETFSNEETFILEIRKIFDLIELLSPEIKLENLLRESKENMYFDSVSVCLNGYFNALLSSLRKIYELQKFENHIQLELGNSDLKPIPNIKEDRTEQLPIYLRLCPYSVLLDLGLSESGLFDKEQFEKGYETLRFLFSLSSLLMNCLKETELLIRENYNSLKKSRISQNISVT